MSLGGWKARVVSRVIVMATVTVMAVARYRACGDRTDERPRSRTGALLHRGGAAAVARWRVAIA